MSDTSCAGDGRIGIDNNPAERPLLGIAVTRKNFLFLGSEAGGDRAAITMPESAKHGLDPKPISPMPSTAWPRAIRSTGLRFGAPGHGRTASEYNCLLLRLSDGQSAGSND
jgi:hypothetical protein